MAKKPEIPVEVQALHSAFIESGMTKAAVAGMLDHAISPRILRRGNKPLNRGFFVPAIWPHENKFNFR